MGVWQACVNIIQDPLTWMRFREAYWKCQSVMAMKSILLALWSRSPNRVLSIVHLLPTMVLRNSTRGIQLTGVAILSAVQWITPTSSWRHQMETFSALMALWVVNNREAGDLRRHRANYDVNVMLSQSVTIGWGTHFTKGLWVYYLDL